MISVEQQSNWFKRMINDGQRPWYGNNLDWLTDIQETAKQAGTLVPAMNRHQETWRYTSVEGLLKNQFFPAGETALEFGSEDLADYLLPEFDSYRLVFVNGQCVPRLSDIKGLPGKVIVGSLRAVLSIHPEIIAKRLGKIAKTSDNLFASLNTALMNDGVFIHVESNVVLDRPIEVIYLNQVKGNATLIQPRNLIVLSSGAKATLVERFIGTDQSVYFQNNLSEIVLAENVDLQHYRIQDESRNAYHLSSLNVSQQANSRYSGTSLAYGAAWSRTDYNTSFQHEGAECELNGLYTVGDQQLCDFHLNICHNVANCVSRERFKGILYGKGRAVFDGRILVNKQAQNSDAQLSNDNLMLTRQAEVDTKPQLEIYADDVKCSHGTTVGQMDPLHIFYLRSRGIDELTARKMLCLGFAGEIIDSIDVPALQEEAKGKLSAALIAATKEKG